MAFAGEEIRTGFDRTADFSNYKTFMWVLEPNPEEPLMKQRIIDAVNLQLRARGLRLVTASADVGVSVSASSKEEQNLERVHNGFPGWGFQKPSGMATARVEPTRTSKLVVDLFDTRTRRVTWWGSASDALSGKPEKNSRKLNKTIQKMFEKFPSPATRKGTGAEVEKPNQRPVQLWEIWENAAVIQQRRADMFSGGRAFLVV
jgi:hypothetical protein